jgi:hypothetical protein
MQCWFPWFAVVGVIALIATKTAAADPTKDDLNERTKLARLRAESANNLKQIGSAIRGYGYEHDFFPPAAITDKKGKPLLSWRVAILQQLKQDELYKQFRFDEPWDSEHNSKLSGRMPKVFSNPQAPSSSLEKGLTHYRVFHGNGAAFDNIVPLSYFGVKDRRSDTWMVVEADEGIPWTKPDDFEFDPKTPLPRFAQFQKVGFNVLYADGTVRFTRRDLTEKTIRGLITANGGETIDVDATEILDEFNRLIREKEASVNNLRNIAVGFHNHASANGGNLLPRDFVDKNGKALLSWRVAILPYMSDNAAETELWKEFRLDEPWDSMHNKQLLEKMPKVYSALGSKSQKGHTLYQAFAGDGTIMNGNPVLFDNFPDGASNTFAVVEAGTAVPWTKPADIPFDPRKPLPKLGGLFDGDFHVVFCDGAIHYVKQGVKEETLKKFITFAGGEKVSKKDLEPAK